MMLTSAILMTVTFSWFGAAQGKQETHCKTNVDCKSLGSSFQCTKVIFGCAEGKNGECEKKVCVDLYPLPEPEKKPAPPARGKTTP